MKSLKNPNILKCRGLTDNLKNPISLIGNDIIELMND